MADGRRQPHAQERSDERSGQRFGHGFLTDTWYLAALSSDLRAGKLQKLRLLGQPVVLGRGRTGAVFALHDVCPHRAAPLSAGRITQAPGEPETLQCPYHGWRFGADGGCVAVPSLTADQTLDVSRIRVRRYPVQESQGLVFLWVGDGEPDHAPPVFPGVVGGAPKLVEQMEFAAHIDHAVIGLMDPAHGPYVHRQWWWRTSGSEHDKAKRFEPRDAGFAMVRHAPSSNSRAYVILGGRPETEITFRLPGLRWEHITVGRRQVLSLTALTPLDDGQTRITQIVWSDHPAFRLLGPIVRASARAFLRQDGDMVNLQAEGLRHDPRFIWIEDADRQAKWYQSLKREWTASRKEGRPFVNPVEPVTLRWRS